MKIKVCGLNNEENTISVINTIHPEFIGHIFYTESKRYIAKPFSNKFYEQYKSIKKVGVFVNDSIENIIEKINAYHLDIIQLHGNESVATCQELKHKISENIKIWKVFSFNSKVDFHNLEKYNNVIDTFLFDTPTKEGISGGTGKKWDWNLLQYYQQNKTFILSGGISIEDVNVLPTIFQSNKQLIGIDINSKFELRPGIKDIALLEKFKKQLL